MIEIRVSNGTGEVLAQTSGEERVFLVYNPAYEEGDKVEMTFDTEGFYQVCFEDTMQESIVYVTAGTVSFPIPFGRMNRIPYPPRAFESMMHLIWATPANPDFVKARRNLALNPFDLSEHTNMFPHASANAQTRGEAMFAPHNAIDGIIANKGHYPYPYQSWGINEDKNAAITVELGTACDIDEIVIVLRADFPHDNYWTQSTFAFSDGSEETVSLVKTEKPQSFKILKKGITSVQMKEMIACPDDPSPFPALRALEVWGCVSN